MRNFWLEMKSLVMMFTGNVFFPARDAEEISLLRIQEILERNERDIFKQWGYTDQEIDALNKEFNK